MVVEASLVDVLEQNNPRTYAVDMLLSNAATAVWWPCMCLPWQLSWRWGVG